MIQDLVENIIWQADYFLKESGEFYPFASIMDKKGEIKPMGILLENDRPSAEEVLRELIQVLNSGWENMEYKAYAIGINTQIVKNSLSEDINQNHPQLMGSKDAVEIRIYTDMNRKEEIICLPYHLNKKTREIQFGDFIKES